MKTDFEAIVLADSLNMATNDRLTTFEVTFPRFILAEVNTHRMLSRNSASSRAIPVRKRVKAIRQNPFVPLAFGKNKAGMQSTEEIADQEEARRVWLDACKKACDAARDLAMLGVHKQFANRLVEPFAWQTAIISATEWQNFYALRCHPDAQPEFKMVAEMMKDEMAGSKPQELQPGMWHLPMLTPGELADVCRARLAPAGSEDRAAIMRWVKISAGRCARVSYLTHDGKRDPDADVELCDRLSRSGHMSPLEHPAMADGRTAQVLHGPRAGEQVGLSYGNFTGFKQYRKFLPNEAVFKGDA